MSLLLPSRTSAAAATALSTLRRHKENEHHRARSRQHSSTNRGQRSEKTHAEGKQNTQLFSKKRKQGGGGGGAAGWAYLYVEGSSEAGCWWDAETPSDRASELRRWPLIVGAIGQLIVPQNKRDLMKVVDRCSLSSSLIPVRTAHPIAQ
jgi:hypothetical protein